MGERKKKGRPDGEGNKKKGKEKITVIGKNQFSVISICITFKINSLYKDGIIAREREGYEIVEPVTIRFQFKYM